LLAGETRVGRRKYVPVQIEKDVTDGHERRPGLYGRRIFPT
jgi:hypothetical protein